MHNAPQLILVAAVAAVGVLHTIVPDHWAPIALFARQRGWSKAETAWRAVQAGIGHVLSTLALALIVWLAGRELAARFGNLIEVLSSAALVAFGAWIAVSAWREMRSSEHADHGRHHHHSPHDHPHHRHQAAAGVEAFEDPLYRPLGGGAAALVRHSHIHRHGRGVPHAHWHDHAAATAHPMAASFGNEPPLHRHRHRLTARTAVLLTIGSSPMVEGIPAFFAAAPYGGGLLALMAGVFAASTIVTYVVLCVSSLAGLERLRLGAVERYGEVLSGGFIALVGIAFGLWPSF